MTVNGVLKWLEGESERLTEECNSNADPYKSVNNSFIEGFNYALANVEVLVDTQLNENQQEILEWLKWSVEDQENSPMNAVNLLAHGESLFSVTLAYIALTNKEQAQVLQIFSQWAMEQEEQK